MATTSKNTKESSSIVEEESTTVSQADLDAKIAELAYYRRRAEALRQGMNWMIGWKLNRGCYFKFLYSVQF